MPHSVDAAVVEDDSHAADDGRAHAAVTEQSTARQK